MCHPSRDRAVFDDLKARRAVAPGEESGLGFVCWSCHNGSVVDSRRALTYGGQHPVGIDVEKTGDKRLRLYGGKRLECGTCHNPHGQHAGAEQWLRMPDDLDAFCTPCHEGRNHYHQGTRLSPELAAAVRGRGGRVGEDGRVGCRTCHTPHGARGPKLLIGSYGTADDEKGICELCHAGKAVEAKLAEGDAACALCHAVHLDARLGLKGGARGPCLVCHDERVAGAGEHPQTPQGCSGCHSIHKPVRTERGLKPFLKSVNAAAFLCQSCHADRMGLHGPAVKVSAQTRELIGNKGFGATAPDGSLACGTCHAVHRAPEPKLLLRPERLACLYCHDQENPYGPAGEAGAHPVGIFLTREQRTVVSEGVPALKDAVPGSEEEALFCGSCHKAHAPGQTPQAPCAQCHAEQAKAPPHVKGGQGCGDCHSIHAKRPPAALCVGCHKESRETLHPVGFKPGGSTLPLYDAQGRRKAFGLASCPTCHDPHGTRQKRLRADTPEGLCLQCHPKKAQMASNTHHGSRQAPPGEQRGDGCLPCHPQHRDFTGEELLGALDLATQRCRACHGTGHTSLPAHTLQGVPPWKQLSGDLPLFNVLGQRDAMGFISCPTCHDIHREGLSLRLPVKETPELCLACHRPYDTLLGTAHDPANWGEKRRCTTCHTMHGQGEKPSVWELETRGAGTWNDRKCLSCHLKGGLEDSPYLGTLSHPVNIDSPKRSGHLGLPLFDPMGAKGGKRIVCGTCHDLHGTRGFDGSVQPLFLRQSPLDGSLCQTCHEKQAAVAGTPHDFSSTGRSELGPCGPCHATHGAKEGGPLWGMETARGDWQPNRLCRGCHTVESRPAEKGPLLEYHMKDADRWLTPRGTIYLQRPMTLWDEVAIKRGKPPVIALFDKEGKAGPHGSLQCISCHEPHRWSPLNPDIKPYSKVGADVPKSFFRFRDYSEVAGSVCADCHPSSTAEYVRRYHKVWTEAGAEVNPSLFPSGP